MSRYFSARTDSREPDSLLQGLFSSYYTGASDGRFLTSSRDSAVGICGLPFKAPVVQELLKQERFNTFCRALSSSANSVLFCLSKDGALSAYRSTGKTVTAEPIAEDLLMEMMPVLNSVPDWAGHINADGEHVIDLKTPSPGPHFYVNLLMGNRTGFDHPLQTTPKSVVDRLGRGSFRSHAATQVLATRWDLRQEENGFPANRQFYLSEGGRQVFYSGNPEHESVVKGTCVHGQNHTRILYETACGLTIERTLFLPKQEPGLPLAVEVQRIAVTNTGSKPRRLRLVCTGMFGPTKPPALMEDVLYSNIIMEGGALFNDDGTVRTVSPRYFPAQDKDDLRFHTMIVRGKSGNSFPDGFCLNYNDFTGRGTLEAPDGLDPLPNELYRKGPGFFALSAEVSVAPGETVCTDNFTGLVSKKTNPAFGPDSLEKETDALIRHFEKPDSVPEALGAVRSFFDGYASFFSLESEDKDFSVYCSKNLPFQVLYQTFVSRSFGQTQKGYREIGFREIQDLFASMYYFHAQGNSRVTKELLTAWVSQVHEFGFANHNFFWEGKEAGNWSDDALWLHQAVGRYVHLTGDTSFLDEQVVIAGTDSKKTRSVYDTLMAAIRYSMEVSVGKHGLPLLDRADWNDCLRLDRNFHTGAEKESIWKETGRYETDCTESVMNAFLAITAAKELRSLAGLRSDEKTAGWLSEKIDSMEKAVRTHAWKGNAYARLLFNQYPGFTHAGAEGDGLDTDGSGGTFFLNSFSWSILSGVANDAEIASMLEVVRTKLKTPYGLKLVSPNDLSRVVPDAASAEYFPGDRENAAVFKHASMMAVSAMLDAAKRVADSTLAKELASEAWTMVDLVYPARTMANPFVLAGNPRFCTQYNNSETGENIGPLLSGTSTWFILALLKAYGIELSGSGLVMDPVLRADSKDTALSLVMGDAKLRVRYSKPDGFRRARDSKLTLTFDGTPLDGNVIPLPLPAGSHELAVTLS